MDNLTPPENAALSTEKPSKELTETWSKMSAILERELSDQTFNTWFQPVDLIEITDKNFSLQVPDSFFGDWLKTNYGSLIHRAAEEIMGHARECVFVVQKNSKNSSPSKVVSESKQAPTNERSIGIEKTPQASTVKERGLNRNYTFDNFVIGPGNRFAHAAALAICDAPARQYNPLFIYGPVGLGKTHLMQSIAHEMKRRHPHFKWTYISSEKFTNQLISAIQKRSTQQFREKYRNVDLLLIDDIHFIAEKEATQEEFFHTFNTLYDAHKQIIVSSDRPPREIPGLEERLVSRFGWGLVTDIQPPDFETRVAILKKKLEKETVMVPDEVLFFIANKIKSNIRELEGAVIRVVAYCTLTNEPLTLKIAQEVLQGSLEEEEKNITIEQIQKSVADYFNLKVSDLRAKRRSRSVAIPRQIAMYLIRKFTTHSFPEIGEYFGGRDHTTVLHGYNKILGVLEKDPVMTRKIEEIESMLKS